jgi:predicted MFS family arabinose efflux permease
MLNDESRITTVSEHVEVLRVPAFRWLWAANGLRDSAAEVADFALPITAVVLLGAGPLAMSLVFVAARSGYLLLGLPAGVWVDRWPKRAVLLGADLVFVAAFASVPVTYLLGDLSITQLVVVAFTGSVASVLFDVAHTSVLPYLLPKRAIADANARLQTSENTVRAVSPGVAGFLTQTVAAPTLYLLTALCHVCSMALVSRIHPHERPVTALAERSFRREIVAGAQMLFGHPLLRLFLIQAALINAGAGIMLSQLPLFLLRDIGIQPWGFGLLSTLGALAGLVASLIAPRLRRRFGEIRMTLVFSALAPLAVLSAPLAGLFRPMAIPLAALAEILIGFVIVGRSIAAGGIRARVTPNEYLGRVSSANSVVTQGATPFGALLGGVVASAWGLPAALWLGVLVMVGPLVALLGSPVARHRTLPTTWEVPG